MSSTDPNLSFRVNWWLTFGSRDEKTVILFTLWFIRGNTLNAVREGKPVSYRCVVKYNRIEGRTYWSIKNLCHTSTIIHAAVENILRDLSLGLEYSPRFKSNWFCIRVLNFSNRTICQSLFFWFAEILYFLHRCVLYLTVSFIILILQTKSPFVQINKFFYLIEKRDVFLQLLDRRNKLDWRIG